MFSLGFGCGTGFGGTCGGCCVCVLSMCVKYVCMYVLVVQVLAGPVAVAVYVC